MNALYVRFWPLASFRCLAKFSRYWRHRHCRARDIAGSINDFAHFGRRIT